MSDKPVNKGPHDLGGTAAGPIDTTDHGMKFWEKQANALRNTLSRKEIVRVDELRRAAEDLGDQYYKLAYFVRRAMVVCARFDVVPGAGASARKGAPR